MRRAYARGTRAWGYDAITGERVLLRELVRDGQTGLPTTRRNWSPKHPQETPADVTDPVALRRPSPDLDRPPYVVSWPTASFTALHETNPPLCAKAHLGAIVIEFEIETVYEDGVYEDGVYSSGT